MLTISGYSVVLRQIPFYCFIVTDRVDYVDEHISTVIIRYIFLQLLSRYFYAHNVGIFGVMVYLG